MNRSTVANQWFCVIQATQWRQILFKNLFKQITKMIKALCESNSHDCWIPFTNGQWFGPCHDIIYVIMRTTPGTCYLDKRSMDKHISGWYRALRVIWVSSLRDAPLCVQIIGVFYQGERMGYQVIQERMDSIKGWWNRLFLSTSCTVLSKSVHQIVL